MIASGSTQFGGGSSARENDRVHGVLDASVASKWFIPEQSTSDSSLLLGQILADAAPPGHRGLVVPEIFFAEVVSAVSKQCRHRAVLERCTNMLDRLPLERVCWASVPVRRCIELIERRVGAYDSVYAAIAIERAIPLVTSDARLARALGEPDWVILVP